MTISLRPKKAWVMRGKSAWWYDERGAISVFIEGLNNDVVSCRIQHRKLEKYIARSHGTGKSK